MLVSTRWLPTRRYAGILCTIWINNPVSIAPARVWLCVCVCVLTVRWWAVSCHSERLVFCWKRSWRTLPKHWSTPIVHSSPSWEGQCCWITFFVTTRSALLDISFYIVTRCTTIFC